MHRTGLWKKMKRIIMISSNIPRVLTMNLIYLWKLKVISIKLWQYFSSEINTCHENQRLTLLAVQSFFNSLFDRSAVFPHIQTVSPTFCDDSWSVFNIIEKFSMYEKPTYHKFFGSGREGNWAKALCVSSFDRAIFLAEKQKIFSHPRRRITLWWILGCRKKWNFLKKE